MQLTFSPAALAKVEAKLDDNTVMILSYEDGVGPYANHNPGAMQIQFDLGLITKDMDKSLYTDHYDSQLGPVYYKPYSAAYLADNLRIDLNESFNFLTMSSDSETIEDNLQIFDFRNK